jgi:hypothetical protein
MASSWSGPQSKPPAASCPNRYATGYRAARSGFPPLPEERSVAAPHHRAFFHVYRAARGDYRYARRLDGKPSSVVKPIRPAAGWFRCITLVAMHHPGCDASPWLRCISRMYDCRAQGRSAGERRAIWIPTRQSCQSLRSTSPDVELDPGRSGGRDWRRDARGFAVEITGLCGGLFDTTLVALHEAPGFRDRGPGL